MNATIRPDRSGVNAGAGSLLPGFAAPQTQAAEFSSVLSDQIPGVSPIEDQEPEGEEKKQEEDGEATVSPFASVFWQPPSLEIKPALNPPPASTSTEPLPGADAVLNGTPVIEATRPPEVELPEAPAGEQVKNSLLELLTPVSEETEFIEPVLQLLPKPMEARQKGSGMRAAQQEFMLSRSQKANEIAAATGQELPEARFFALDVEFSAALLQPAPMRIPLKQEGPGIPVLPSLPLQTELPSVSGSPAQALEGTPVREIDFSLIDSINEHIQFLRAGTNDSIEVSLSPDSETELFLRIQKIDGEISVQVRLDRGNFADLEFQWPQLQQTLAAQGIKLEELGTSNSNSGLSAHDQRESSQPEREDRTEPAPEAKIISRPTPNKPAPSDSTGSSSRWQRWA